MSEESDISGNAPSSSVNTLMCFSVLCSDKPQHVQERVKHSSKIFLPESMLHQHQNGFEQNPLYVKLIHPTYTTSTVCGVEEFTAPPGCIIVPNRIMDEILVTEGENVNIEVCFPLKGTYIKIRPHKTAFTELSNPKAVLERSLTNHYPVVSVDDTITIKYLDDVWRIDIVECKPGNTIDILNADVNLDFDTPADYVEPPKITKEVQEQTTDNLPTITGVNKKIAFSDNATLASNDVSSARNTKLDSFKTIKTGLFVPFSGAGNKLGSS